MDIRPIKPFKRPLAPKRSATSQTVEEATPLKVPEELLESGRKIPLLSAKNSRPGRKKWFILCVGGVVALVGIVMVAAFVWYTDALQPRSAEDKRIQVAIEPGATPEQIADELEQKQVIKSSFAFQLLLRQNNSRGKLQAGTYLLSPRQSSQEVLAWLVEGRVDTFNVTILPGQTLRDIKEALIKDGFAAADIDAAFAKKYEHPLVANKPDAVNLEGYIFPETYQVSSNTTAEQLFIRTFDEFYARIEAEGLKARLSALGFNLHQGITLASIVQRETSNQTDQRQVAQVFEKRLKEDVQLGSDVTFMYAAELLGQPESIAIDSPYNTRRYKGLPPGAIANFTMSALAAVADPAQGDYMYFVAGDDGVTHFARTEAEHQDNIDRYCTKLCSE